MVVGEPSLMGGEFGDEDERLITRLENTQYDTTGVEDGGNGGAPQGAGPGGPGPGPAGPTPFNNSPMTAGPGGPWPDPARQPQETDCHGSEGTNSNNLVEQALTKTGCQGRGTLETSHRYVTEYTICLNLSSSGCIFVPERL